MKAFNQRLPKAWIARSRVFLAMGDENRQRILLMFERGEELSMKSIIDASPQSRTAVMHHIRCLLDAEILSARKQGQSVYLKPNPAVIAEAMNGVLTYIRESL
jgi:DNA-binding transcriptional ArsR family regulator